MSTLQVNDSESEYDSYFQLLFLHDMSNDVSQESPNSVIKVIGEKISQAGKEKHQLPPPLMRSTEISQKSSTQTSKILEQEIVENDLNSDSNTSEKEMKNKKTETTDMIDTIDISEYPFDPRTQPLSEEELKPQASRKRSRKKSVPDCSKTDRYWSRRYKNNVAAKESRINRRLKENQIVLRTGFLEQENTILKQENDHLKKENELLKQKIQSLSNPEK